MIARLLAIAFIFAATTVAWMILGASIQYRTESADHTLRGRVESSWGGPHLQLPPRVWFATKVKDAPDIVTELGVQSSRVQVDLRVEHRQKGLLWYNTFQSAFDGTYTFRNDTGEAREFTLTAAYPSAQAVYDNVELYWNGARLETRDSGNAVAAAARIEPGETVTLRFTYRSQGLDRWQYRIAKDTGRARDFQLKVRSNFTEVDFPENTLPPSSKRESGDGLEMEWRFTNAVSGFPIAVQMPEKLQPGPVAGRISFFAPVSLFFFFFVMLLITTLGGIDLHPVNYFFLAAAFFAFHLLMAYLADHVSIHAAFAVSAAVSMALVLNYLRMVVGGPFAYQAALAQLIYLILFSYAFFLKGYTGLAITIGAILTLFVAMQLTAKVRWADYFQKPAAG
jgi:hypothetical protein